jgi:acetyl-CoA carboxylase biotin carboxyl carrier protein
MSDLGFDLVEIARLIKLVEQRGLSELIVEEDDRRIVIRGVGYKRREQTVAAPAPSVASGTGAEHAAPYAAHVPAEEPAPAENRVPVLSPMVGVFYRSSGPDAAPYVEVGDHVEAGQTIGMIEAMKVFSEVPSDHAGRVAEIVAENGQLVRANDPILFVIPDHQ